ncbi:MAG: efflux RND transporter permease subunit, partial [Planctomycetota bacterium]
EFEALPVLNGPDGNELLLGDVAIVRDGFEETDTVSTFNGLPAITLDVYRIGEQTPVEVASAVKRVMAEMKEGRELPPGCSVVVTRDRSSMFIDRMNLLLRNAAIGLALVLVLLGVFLEARLAFWVTMGIPISFLGAFVILPLFGISINMISMFAFIIALGIVVDDAIVVGENVYQHMQEGMPFLKAARAGAQEVAMPVTFSVLTNIAAFMPMFFVPGFMGKVFKVIPAVVVTVFAISLVESLLILPAHLAHGGGGRRRGLSLWVHERQQAFSHWFKHMVRDVFGPFHVRVLHNRYLAIGLGFLVLLTTIGFVASGRMGRVLFPKVESDYAIATAVLPYGVSVERSVAVKNQLLTAANQVVAAHGGETLAKGVQASVGGNHAGVSGTHVVEVRIHLQRAGVRPIGTKEVVGHWRKAVPPMPGLEVLKFEADRGGPGSGASLTVELRHKELGVLEEASEELAAMLSEVSMVRDVDDGFSPGKPQYDFSLLPAGRSLGLTATGVARQVRNAFYGAEVLRQQRGRNEIKVKVRLPKSERTSEYDIEEMMIRTPAGRDVPLKEMVRIRRGRAYTSINRRAGARTVTVSANVVPEKQTGQVQAKVIEEFLPELQQRFPGLQGGFEGKQKDMKDSMSALGVGFLFALFVIYILLAIPFNSYAQPAIIMVSIPFGIVGAVIGHAIMGYSMSIISMMGVVALSGVVVNDSLVLIDFANRARQDGMKPFDAVHLAAIRRFRPIMLTTLTTFGGLAPMIFETSRQARFLIPMALSLGYGILFATLISLLLVPCFYLVIEDIRGTTRR